MLYGDNDDCRINYIATFVENGTKKSPYTYICIRKYFNKINVMKLSKKKVIVIYLETW